MLLAQLSDGVQSLPLLPTSKLCPSGADSKVSGFVYVLRTCGSLQQTLLWGLEFLLPPQPSQVFSVKGFEALFPGNEILGCVVCFAPQLFLPVYLHSNVGPPAPPATASPWLPAATLPALVLQPPTCWQSSLPGCPTPPLLLVWMNVSSLTPWLWYCHTVQFSVSSGFFFFVFKFVVHFLVVRGGTVCLSMPPSWLEVQFVLKFNVSGYILLAYWFCWLGPTYRWDHMVFVFYCLAYFT